MYSNINLNLHCIYSKVLVTRSTYCHIFIHHPLDGFFIIHQLSKSHLRKQEVQLPNVINIEVD
jgi:hypothetical protein